MPRVRLLHWNAVEASKTQEMLANVGFEVEYEPTFDSAQLRQWRSDPPAAFVIDLSRLPSRGREIAVFLRQSPKTRQIPLIFCDGDPEKVARVREVLPDAAYCSSGRLIRTLKNARPADAPLRPVDMMSRFGSRSTAQKLGIKEGTTVALVNPPRNVNTVLGALPDRVEFVEHDAPVTLCFIHSADDLRTEMPQVRRRAAKTKLWIVWPKKSSSNFNGVTGDLVRNTGIDLGLIDYKICSVDEHWSAMLFTRRKG
jgi:CheY-like chemotaxis protein